MIALTSHADGHMSLRADDVRDLPELLKELAEMGIDLSKCEQALKEIKEEQRERDELARKKKALEDRERSRKTKLSEAKVTLRNPRRFIITYNNIKGDTEVKTGQGVVYGNGRIDCSAGWPFIGATSIDALKKYGEEAGYECSIEFIDD